MIAGIVFLVLGCFCFIVAGILFETTKVGLVLYIMLGCFCVFLGVAFIYESRDIYYKTNYDVINIEELRKEKIKYLEKELSKLKE